MRGATDVPSTKDINIEALSRRPPAGSKLKGSGTATPALKAIEIKAYSCSIGTRETDPRISPEHPAVVGALGQPGLARRAARDRAQVDFARVGIELRNQG